MIVIVYRKQLSMFCCPANGNNSITVVFKVRLVTCHHVNTEQSEFIFLWIYFHLI